MFAGEAKGPPGGRSMTAPFLPPSPDATRMNPALDLPETYNAAAAFLDGPLARGWANRVAIRAGGADWTYAQVVEGANRAGNAFRALGVEMEQRVAMLVYDSPQYAAAFF